MKILLYTRLTPSTGSPASSSPLGFDSAIDLDSDDEDLSSSGDPPGHWPSRGSAAFAFASTPQNCDRSSSPDVVKTRRARQSWGQPLNSAVSITLDSPDREVPGSPSLPPHSLELAFELACDSSPEASHAWTPLRGRGRGGGSLQCTPVKSVDGDDGDALERALGCACDGNSPLGPLSGDDFAPETHEPRRDADSLEHALDLASSPPPSHIDSEDTADEVADPLPVIIIARAMIASLFDDDAEHLKGQLRNLADLVIDSCTMGLLLTTACSGTDLVSSVLTIFFEACTWTLSSALLCVEHLWSCESNKWKSDWIKRVVGQRVVFSDAADLSKGYAMTHGMIEQLVTVGFLHAVGFSCKSVSMLNPNRKKFAKCIKFQSGTTGSTFWSSLKFIRRFLPILVWMENVRGFTGTNLQLAIKLLRTLGYVVIALCVDPTQHGVPCRRHRWWIIAKLAPSACKLEDCNIAQQKAKALEVALRQPSMPLNKFLIPDGHELPAQRPPARKRRKWVVDECRMMKRRKWVAAHAEHWEQSTITKPEVVPDALVTFAHELSQRELDVAMFDRIAHADKYYEACAEERIADLSQGITRYPRSSQLCPTITPSARLALLNRAEPRFITGQERLALQGFSPSMATAQRGKDAILDFTERRLN